MISRSRHSQQDALSSRMETSIIPQETARQIMAREMKGLPRIELANSISKPQWSHLSPKLLESIYTVKDNSQRQQSNSPLRSIKKIRMSTQQQQTRPNSFAINQQMLLNGKKIRRKSAQESIISSKQLKLEYLYPITVIQQHDQLQTHQHNIRKRTVFQKMSNILLKHTYVIRALNFWTRKASPIKRQQSPDRKGKGDPNPILLYNKLKQEVALYKEERQLFENDTNNEKLQELEIKIQQLCAQAKIEAQNYKTQQLHQDQTKVILNLQKKSSRQSLAMQTYIKEKQQIPIIITSNPMSPTLSTHKQLIGGCRKQENYQLHNYNKLKTVADTQTVDQLQTLFMKPAFAKSLSELPDIPKSLTTTITQNSYRKAQTLQSKSKIILDIYNVQRNRKLVRSERIQK